MTGSGFVGLIVWPLFTGRAKVIMSRPGFAFASSIAWRKLPAPKTFVVLTENVAAWPGRQHETKNHRYKQKCAYFMREPQGIAVRGRFQHKGARSAKLNAVLMGGPAFDCIAAGGVVIRA